MTSHGGGELRPWGWRLLLALAGTGAFCLLVAGLLVLAFGFDLRPSLITSLCIGYSIHGGAAGLGRLFGHRLSLAMVLGLAVPLGIVSGYLLAEWLLTGSMGAGAWLQPQSLALGGMFGLLGAILFFLGSSVSQLRDSLHEEQVERLAGEKAMAEQELRLLQAQIEPHFLFNTLSNVLVLLRSDSETAARVLEQLTRLLRVSLKRTRNATTTLAEEAELLAAYLDIASVRMGSRLRWKIELPPDLRAVEIPPLLLQPLVENALEHGIDPRPEGGCIRLHARREGAELWLSVVDDGLGLTASASRAGLALDNVRSRLRALYGSAARLELLQPEAGGTEARICLPAEA